MTWQEVAGLRVDDMVSSPENAPILLPPLLGPGGLADPLLR